MRWIRNRKTLFFLLALWISLGCFDLEKTAIPVTICEKCTQEHCQEELDACSKSVGCYHRYQCLLGCSKDNPECRIRCGEEDSRPTEKMIALDICRDLKCWNECDQCGSSMFDLRGAACSRCMQKNECCSKTAACARDRYCNTAIRGRMACSDPYCVINDGQPYDGTYKAEFTPERTELEECFKKCNTDCGLGTDFECSSKYEIPKMENQDAGMATIQELAREFPLSIPVSSVQMTIHEDGSETDKKIMKESLTEKGLYEQTVRAPFSGFIRAQKQGYFTTTHHFSRPLMGHEQHTAWLVSETLLSLAEKLEDKTIDTKDHGAIFVTLGDCTDTNARGAIIKYSAEDQSGDMLKYYTDDIIRELMKELSEQTIVTIFLNVPPGPGVLEAQVGSSELEVSYYEIEVVAGEMAWVELSPLIGY